MYINQQQSSGAQAPQTLAPSQHLAREALCPTANGYDFNQTAKLQLNINTLFRPNSNQANFSGANTTSGQAASTSSSQATGAGPKPLLGGARPSALQALLMQNLSRSPKLQGAESLAMPTFPAKKVVDVMTSNFGLSQAPL